MQAAYDFIICGGGTAGCVVARRLAESTDARVLVLEAGGDERIDAVRDATAWMSNIGSERDWRFESQPGAALDGRRASLPMGKVLGGGSSVNGLIWARGHRQDFNRWAELTGDPGWSYPAVLDLYRRIEDWDGPPDPTRRGTGGPVYVSRPRQPVPLVAALIEATAAAGVPFAEDLNGATMEGDGGCGIPNTTVTPSGARVSMAGAYLRPVMTRPNLTVRLHAEVLRLLFERTRVVGVEYLCEGQVTRVRAQCEVVLSLGALNTPRVLMHSGIGDEQQLQRHGIARRHHLPGVGRHFQDHIWSRDACSNIGGPKRRDTTPLNLRSSARATLSSARPICSRCSRNAPSAAMRRRAVYPPLPSDPAHAFTLAPGLVRPHSRGHLELISSRPTDALAVHANFLSDPRDVRALLRAVDLCRDIGNSTPVREFARCELMPGPLEPGPMERWLRRAAGTYFHQTCTAKMGRDADSVVDGSLRVHGVQNLRIADGSVMPEITTGNTMAPCVLIGERAADLIRATYSTTADHAGAARAAGVS